MTGDIGTILWKEIKELVFMRGNSRGGLIGLLVFIGVFGVFMPLQSGRAWVETPVSLVYWAWLPFLLVSSVVADSFAGERERHTLETLLASRLSDQAILFGKIGAAVAYGWGLTMISVVLGLISVNLAFGQGELLIYSPVIFFSIIGLSFLIAGLAAGLGVLVSLRSATVRQAQQTFSLAFFLLFIPLFAINFVPESWKVRLVGVLASANISTTLYTIMAVLLVIDAIVILAAMSRFRRAQLILD